MSAIFCAEKESCVAICGWISSAAMAKNISVHLSALRNSD
jgi:hypothetical protein